MNITSFIFARGGSKSLPGKNIRNFCGKPLIAWSIEQAQSIGRIQRVIVSTDSNEIASVARDYGAEVPFIRPRHLAEDTSPEIYAWRHALGFLEDNEGYIPDVFVSLPCTSPLRETLDIEKCIDCYLQGDAEYIVTGTDSYRNPFFNMLKRTKNGKFSLVIESDDDIYRRQDAIDIFDISCVAFVSNPQIIYKNDNMLKSKLMLVEIAKHSSIDIDTLEDFEYAEYLMNKRLLKQK